jgi:putative flippase GtrA
MAAFSKAAQEAEAAPTPIQPLTVRQRRQLIVQYVRFSLVGLSNAIVDLGILNLLLRIRPTTDPFLLVLDNTIAVAAAILNSYIWNSRWTFRPAATGSSRERVLFVAQGILNVAVNDLVLLGMTAVLEPREDLGYLVISNLAKLVAMLTASTLSFFLLRTIVFRR